MDIVNNEDIIDGRDNIGNTALHIAAELGLTSMVELLVDCGASLLAQNSHGMYPLHLAVEANNVSTVKRLIDLAGERLVLGMLCESLKCIESHYLPVATSCQHHHYKGVYTNEHLLFDDICPCLHIYPLPIIHHFGIVHRDMQCRGRNPEGLQK